MNRPARHLHHWTRRARSLRAGARYTRAAERKDEPSCRISGVYVRSLRIERFRHLSDIEIGPFTAPPQTSDLIALAGPNGGGKSSILELVSYGLSNAWAMNWQLARTFVDFSFEISIGLTDAERDLVRAYLESRGVLEPA